MIKNDNCYLTKEEKKQKKMTTKIIHSESDT